MTMHRPLNNRVSVSGQIDPGDLAAIKDQGFAVIVDARPDNEVPASHGADAMEKEAASLGLAFRYIPMVPGNLPDEDAAKAFAEASREGRVFAYCGGGPRAVVLASFAAATENRDLETILAEARNGGMDLQQLAPLLVSFGAKGH